MARAHEGELWQLKGSGNANLVFAYAGTDPRLVRGWGAVCLCGGWWGGAWEAWAGGE